MGKLGTADDIHATNLHKKLARFSCARNFFMQVSCTNNAEPCWIWSKNLHKKFLRKKNLAQVFMTDVDIFLRKFLVQVYCACVIGIRRRCRPESSLYCRTVTIRCPSTVCPWSVRHVYFELNIFSSHGALIAHTQYAPKEIQKWRLGEGRRGERREGRKGRGGGRLVLKLPGFGGSLSHVSPLVLDIVWVHKFHRQTDDRQTEWR